MNKNCSNLEREIQRCLILLDLSDSFLSESCFMKMLRDEMKGVAKEIQPHLDNLYVLSDFLGDYELMNLEFINAFGIYEFIEASDSTGTIEALLSLCSLVCKAIDVSALDSSYFSCSKDYKRAERRLAEVRTRTRAIQLGSTAIYSKISEDSDDSENSEKGSLVRSEGIIYKKCIEAMSKATKTPWSKSKFVAAYKFLERTRHLVRLAKVYENYTIFYHGRYLKDISKDSQSSDVSKDNEDTAVKNGKKDVYFVQILEELAGCEYRYSGKYVKVHGNDNADASPEDTVSEYPSEKGDVPMSVRRNKHSVNISPSDKMQMNTNKMLTISTCEVSLKPFVTTPNRSYGFL